MAEHREYMLNFGPQHPAAHGLLRLMLKLDGEIVVHADPHVGFLHRGVEKIAENKRYNQIIPYVDRLDYVSALANEHAFVLAIEKILQINAPIRAKYIRVMFDEITRLLSHLLWVGAHALDIGAMTVFLYTMREREKLLDMYEAVSGSRMHPNFYRPGGICRDLPDNPYGNGLLLDLVEKFSAEFPANIDEYENMLTNNRIWKKRTVGIGVVLAERAKQLSFTGPMLRGSGVNWDLRKQQPYAVYDRLEFDIPVETAGDCYARYLIHIEEMRQSNRIIKQCIAWLRANPGEVTLNSETEHRFEYFAKGFNLPKGEVYAAVEHPKGEFGIYLISDGGNKPYRMKIRAGSFPHIAGLNELVCGHMIADVSAIISSTDVMFGEIDR